MVAWLHNQVRKDTKKGTNSLYRLRACSTAYVHGRELFWYLQPLVLLACSRCHQNNGELVSTGPYRVDLCIV